MEKRRPLLKKEKSRKKRTGPGLPSKDSIKKLCQPQEVLEWDQLFNRIIGRKVSLFLTSLFLKQGITGSQMVVIAFSFLFLGSIAFFPGIPVFSFTGSILILLWFFLDQSAAEISRFNRESTPESEFLERGTRLFLLPFLFLAVTIGACFQVSREIGSFVLVLGILGAIYHSTFSIIRDYLDKIALIEWIKGFSKDRLKLEVKIASKELGTSVQERPGKGNPGCASKLFFIVEKIGSLGEPPNLVLYILIASLADLIFNVKVLPGSGIEYSFMAVLVSLLGILYFFSSILLGVTAFASGRPAMARSGIISSILEYGKIKEEKTASNKDEEEDRHGTDESESEEEAEEEKSE